MNDNDREARLIRYDYSVAYDAERILREELHAYPKSRRQVWFADKDHNGATHVYPLSDYSPSQDKSVANGYVVGHYSAVPVIPDLFGLAAPTKDEGEEHDA